MLRWPAAIDRLLQDRAARFARDGRAAAAVEFAMISVVFVFTLFAAFSVSLVIFLRMELDFATLKAARQIMNGTAQKGGYSSDSFRTKVVCAYLPAAFDCGNVIVNVQTASEALNPGGYYAFVKSDLSGLLIPNLSNGAASYNIGVQGSYVYMQVIYPITFLPSFVTSVIGNGQTYNGNPAYLAVSTAAFRNEQF